MPKMTWPNLLCPRRFGKADGDTSAPGPRTDYQRDFDRILFSSAFRRMQDKTQVFPLARNDYVRTRLTHSLEVSTVGRSLGTLVGERVIDENRELKELGLTAADFGSIVAAACLAHDIGNPPFGHAGEKAIQEWFKDSGSNLLKKWMLGDAQREDLSRFEGNAQGFRLLTRLLNAGQLGGLQLTYAVLATFTKYPRPSHLDVQAPPGISGKKFGFVDDDRAHFKAVADAVGLLRKAPEVDAWYRHPLAFLVEAADDICYRIIDVEDGYRSGHLQFDEINNLFAPLLDSKNVSRASSMSNEKNRVEFMRAVSINRAINEVVPVFLANESAILAGEYDRELMADIESKDAYGHFVTLARKKVYQAREVIEIEACGYRVLAALMSEFAEAVDDCASNGSSARSSSKTLAKLMNTYGTALDGLDSYQRGLRTTDFVSGMTDTHALETYRRISGISLP